MYIFIERKNKFATFVEVKDMKNLLILTNFVLTLSKTWKSSETSG